MTYRSPVADILFSLKAVAGLPELIGAKLDGEFDWETIASVISEAGRFATEEIAPLNRAADTVGAAYANGAVTTPPGFADAYRRWAEAGWGGVSAPAEFGGMALPHLVNVACTEIWNGASMAFALCPLLTEGAIGALKAYGSKDLLDVYLEAMISGRWTGTMNLTEPQAGSDLNAVQNARRARRRRDLPPVRPEDLHHLWRARHGREHRPSRPRPPARRAGRHARPVAVPRPEIPGQPGREPRRAQRPALRQHRAQARHPRLADLRHDLRRERGRQGLAHRRGEPRPRRHVRDDERGAARGRHAGRRHRRARLPAGPRIRPRAPAGPQRQGRRRQGRRRNVADHRASRRAAHADDDEGLRSCGARDLPPDRRRRSISPIMDGRRRSGSPAPIAPPC